MIGAYNFNEKSPVISFKNGGFGVNYKNKKASENLLSNFAKCKRLTEKKIISVSNKKEQFFV